MPAPHRKVRLIYFVVLTLLLVGLLPLVFTGWLLSDKSGRELRSAENRYQIQLVQEKARSIEMFGNRYADLVSSVAASLEFSGSTAATLSPQIDTRLAALLRDNTELYSVYVKPVTADSLSVFRAEHLSRNDVESIAADSATPSASGKVDVGSPHHIASTGADVITFSSPVVVGGEAVAKVVAIVSLRELSKNIVGFSSAKDQDLWRAGLPIIFVVDEKGRTVFHPDAAMLGHESTKNLRIVEEWRESGAKVESALVPFTTAYDGKTYDMIGAYSTARISGSKTLGVITMQDERTALATVGEMRTQTWLISMAFAVLALIVGFLGSRLMTAPLLRLVAAARQIAAGDFSARVETQSMTEIGTLGESFNLMTDKIEEQIANLANAAAENRELFEGTVKALAAAIDGKDKYTRGHSERVSRISVAIGKRLGLPADELETLRMSALLHDIGKIGIDDSILKKPAALTDEEYEIMKTHPQRGYKIMSQIPAMKDFLPGMYSHHEMVNGMGYPQGLKGDQIPMQAKIVSVADTFDAMTIDRPYSKGMELAAALTRLREFVGTRYESSVVEALIDACNAGEVANGIVRQLEAKRNAAEAVAQPIRMVA